VQESTHNSVNFGKAQFRGVAIRASSVSGAILQLRLNSVKGTILSEIKIPKNSEWKITNAKVLNVKPGIQNLFVVLKSGSRLEVDWITFKYKK